MDYLAERGGALDNVYDLGRSFRGEHVPVFEIVNHVVGDVVVNRRAHAETYSLYKHIGGGSGGVTISIGVNPDLKFDAKVYQLWTHGLKAANPSFAIPRTGFTVSAFPAKYEALIANLEGPFRGNLGGFRIEISVKGPTFTQLRESFQQCLDIEYFRMKGLRIVKWLPESLILDQCKVGRLAERAIRRELRTNGRCGTIVASVWRQSIYIGELIAEPFGDLLEVLFYIPKGLRVDENRGEVGQFEKPTTRRQLDQNCESVGVETIVKVNVVGVWEGNMILVPTSQFSPL